MLLNYGGRRGMYGDVDLISSRPITDLKAENSTMVRKRESWIDNHAMQSYPFI
jgi:hypothetical protein